MPSLLHIRTFSSGYTALFGDAIDSIVQSFAPNAPPPKHAYHVTLMTKEESRELSDRGATSPFTENSTVEDLVPIGCGSNCEGTFIVVLINSAAKARKTAALPIRDFHITLITSDHVSPDPLDKGLATLVSDPLAHGNNLSPSLLDALYIHHKIRNECFEAEKVAGRIVAADVESFKSFGRLGEMSLCLHRHNLAMLAFGQVYDLTTSPDVQRYSLAKIVECSAFTEWGSTMTADELDEFNNTMESLEVRKALLRPWSDELKTAVVAETEGENYVPPMLQIESRTRVYRWIIPFRLAVSAEPRDESDIDILASPALGIRHILTLTEERKLQSSWFQRRSISNTFLPVKDMSPPSIEQFEAFLSLANNSQASPLLVHCAGGKGRAGSMICAYLACYGFARSTHRQPWYYPAMGWRQALEILRNIRPGSVETEAQEQRIKTFMAHVAKRGSVLPPTMEEPTTPDPVIEGTISKSTNLIVLVGLPGSGKSSFRNALVARDPSWRYISGDEDGGSNALITAVSNHCHGKLIVDRVNPTTESRKYLLELTHHANAPICVYFDVPATLCLERAQKRTDHPTLPPGGRVKAAIKQFEATLEKPERKEGFDAVVTITSIPSSIALVHQLAAPITLFKFPRTAHLINVGAATEDDLTRPLAVFNVRQGSQVIVTEKVDGANVALSLDSSRRILTQNRSHYVNSGTHIQFKKLGLWVDNHREELDSLLGADETFIERFVLFGEWMAAVHSVHYSHLPDLFIAFDLYDRVAQKFVSRKELEWRLKGTKIPLTPVIHEGDILSEEEMLRLIQTQSSFADGRLEGIYVKIEDENWVLDR
ncbi:ATP dependent DNA ligase [Penicillium taxi]|uniref:ATP dependent DNA ligase n=1 Tax=Penicillium taxi TaxID=168475 RepID=UPI002544F902|nr:ATP dependent DNA ligase [Penicillium taxi]KAJ5888818.1 ATP dependent DNA ligase [Penicillium taxi]